jgi:hypothetical protein
MRLLSLPARRFVLLERFQAKWRPVRVKKRVEIRNLERFRAKWTPVRVKKTRQIKNLEPRFDSIETEKALAARFRFHRNRKGFWPCLRGDA